MVGSDSDKARSMFAFTMLSLAINYWVSHNKKAPDEPFIYFLNYKPLRDDYFIDAPGLLATELLTKYVKNIPIFSNPSEIKNTIQKLYSASLDAQSSAASENKYLMVFGYQRAEDLKSEDKAAEKQDIMSMMSSRNQESTHSMKEINRSDPDNGSTEWNTFGILGRMILKHLILPIENLSLTSIRRLLLICPKKIIHSSLA